LKKLLSRVFDFEGAGGRRVGHEGEAKKHLLLYLCKSNSVKTKTDGFVGEEIIFLFGY